MVLCPVVVGGIYLHLYNGFSLCEDGFYYLWFPTINKVFSFPNVEIYEATWYFAVFEVGIANVQESEYVAVGIASEKLLLYSFSTDVLFPFMVDRDHFALFIGNLVGKRG